MSDYSKWVESFESIGVNPVSDDTCCRLLAIIHVFGGDSELFTYNLKMKTDTLYAQRRLNIGGTLIPNVELSKRFKQYVKELEHDLETTEYSNNKSSSVFKRNIKTEWAVSMMLDRYNIQLI